VLRAAGISPTDVRGTWAQGTQQERTLVINGQGGDAAVVQINGRTYVDLESPVRIGNGSLGFQGNQVIVTLPASAAPVAVSEPQHSFTGALSREFMKAAIEEIALLREWASPLANAIQNGYPVTENWVAGYREKAANGLRVASMSVSSEGDQNGIQLPTDQNGIQLPTNEFEAVREWSSRLVNARKSMDTAKYALSANALQNDPLSQKILTCARFLSPMLESGSFQDDPSCR
jgi:hypothetical protein